MNVELQIQFVIVISASKQVEKWAGRRNYSSQENILGVTALVANETRFIATAMWRHGAVDFKGKGRVVLCRSLSVFNAMLEMRVEFG